MKKAIIGIAVAVVVIAAVVPVAYGTMQRATVASLKFDFNRFELKDVDFSETSTMRTLNQVVGGLENPSSDDENNYVSIGQNIESISSPEGVVIDFLSNTQLIFSMFVDVQNPSYIEAIIDRAQANVAVNGYPLSKPIEIRNQYKIPPGGTTTIELHGIAVNGRDIASILVNFASDDFILSFDFGIVSYFPTLFGEVQIPADVNVKLYVIPPKPSFDSSSGFTQIGYNVNSYELTFQNNNEVPISGKFETGVMKGNSLSSLGIGEFCDPACLPMDNGLLNFIRIKLKSIEVFESNNVGIVQGDSYTMTIDNPELRNKKDSAFIVRWGPDYSKIPYVITSKVLGVSDTKTGEFESTSLSTVRKIVYNLVRDFGYLGNVEFESPDKSTFLTMVASSDSAYGAGAKMTFEGRLVDAADNGIPNALIHIKEDDRLDADDLLSTGYTNVDGYYSIDWTIEDTEGWGRGDTAEIYAIFEGDEWHEKSDSDRSEINTGTIRATITFSSSSDSVEEGSVVRLNGRLVDSDGKGISNALIYLKDDRTLRSDDELDTTYTDSQGYFTFTWNADGSIDAYAIFEGSPSYQKVRSQNIEIEVQEYRRGSTSISLHASPSSAYEGSPVQFSGRLTETDGNGISNQAIDIKDDDSGPDDLIVSINSDSGGYFSYTWYAEFRDPTNDVVDAYAVFEGSSQFEGSRSTNVYVQIYEYEEPSSYSDTSLSIDVSNLSPDEGEIVEISGRLVDDNGDGVANMVIYIKDEDTGSGDDLIATVSTDSNGSYSFEWVAESRDPFDNVVEVYSVFEGTSLNGESRSDQVNVQVN